eukprot:357809-Chlamydomonas_euryale.AAC.4
MVDVSGAAEAGRSPASSSKRSMPGELQRTTLKYKKYSSEGNPDALNKKPPSQHIRELTQPTGHSTGWRPKPKIIELLNIADFTNQVHCDVSVDEPIFQPFPPEVLFHTYEPFKNYEATLFFRNNDTVSRVAWCTVCMDCSHMHMAGLVSLQSADR